MTVIEDLSKSLLWFLWVMAIVINDTVVFSLISVDVCVAPIELYLPETYLLGAHTQIDT